MVSMVGSSGAAPCVGQRPKVVLRPNRPLNAAGTRTDPPVSVPMAKAHMPAAVAAAEPELEPPGTRCRSASQGLRGVTRGSDNQMLPRQNSSDLVDPQILSHHSSVSMM